jgi:undecaprenyl diphosphate synthase
MSILRIYLRKELRRMVRENIRFNAIGRLQDLPNSVQGLLFETMAQTSQNDGMIFTLALSYGSRMEIIDAVQRLAHAVQRGELHPEGITPALFSNFCIPSGCPTQTS